MRTWIKSWWKDTGTIIKGLQLFALAAAIFLIVSLFGGYFYGWTWTGFSPYTPPTSDYQRGATLYDWLQLAVVPAAIAFGVVGLSRSQQKRDQRLAEQRAKSEQEAAEGRDKTEREIAEGNQCEAALKEYYDNMSELLLHENYLNQTLIPR